MKKCIRNLWYRIMNKPTPEQITKDWEFMNRCDFCTRTHTRKIEAGGMVTYICNICYKEKGWNELEKEGEIQTL